MASSGGGAELTIGELARHFGLATHVLRHWEAEGLLTPERNAAGRRRYRHADLFRVAAIRLAKEAGLPLPEIRLIITTRDPAARADAMRRQRQHLVERIAIMQASLALLDGALACQHGDIAACPNFQALLAERVKLPTTARGPIRNHRSET
jgi:MerR family copper efflux transcriptional regulator